MPIRWCPWVVLLIAATISLASAEDDRPATSLKEQPTNSPLNADSPTLGGKQFWTDELVHGGWRIQRNVLSGHCRLLDERNVRRGWGTYEQCQQEFQHQKDQGHVPALKPKVILVLHGLVRTRDSMANMSRYLEEHGEYSVINVSYASARAKLADHATALGRVIERLEGVQEINFVAHSLGNLVIRHYLGDHTDPVRGLVPDARIHRIVMIAPPNNGTELANRFRNNLVFQTVWGESGQELADDWVQLEKHMAVPQCPFGVIAGGWGNDHGLNPLLPGDDDFVVAVNETRLVGAADFAVVPAPHGDIMDHRKVQEMTLRFIRDGYFTAAENRRPILPVKAAPRP